MPSAFISYRRVDSAALATLIAVRLKDIHGIDAYVDTRNTDGGGPFPDRLRSSIERSDVFVCLLGATSLESDWVLTEIEYAHNLHKIMIPVFQERYVAPKPIPNEHVEALLQSDGVQFIDVRNLYIDQAITQLAEMIQISAPRRTKPLKKAPFYSRSILIAVVLAIVTLLAVIFLNLNAPHNMVTPTTYAVINPSEASKSAQLNALDTPTVSATPAPILTATLEIAFIVQTLDHEATTENSTLNAQVTDAVRATAYAVGTRSMVDQTATARLWTPTPSPNITATIEAYRTQTAATAIFNQTATATLWTPTPTPTKTPIPLGYPGNPVLHNGDWKPVYQTFDGVEMARVPVGCFLMGSVSGEPNEQPINKQCFDQPFWIDRYEVTNKQFGTSGGSKGEDRPRESVTWSQAYNFCQKRDSRLPTEREWEYAARGPNSLTYPWGNDFVPSNVIYSHTSNRKTADVGSRPTGDSWVGASDLGGNVWEWVNTIYGVEKNGNSSFSDNAEKLFPYPYDASDGRESNSDNSVFMRVARGGSLSNDETFIRSAYRNYQYPTSRFSDLGFRCARSY